MNSSPITAERKIIRCANSLKIMSKFARCYPANGFMWCQHFNGSYAPPFPLSDENEKSPKENSLDDVSEENQTDQ